MNEWVMWSIIIFFYFYLKQIGDAIECIGKSIKRNEEENTCAQKDNEIFDHITKLVTDLGIIVADIKRKVDVGLPLWKRDYPWFHEYKKNMVEIENGWLAPFLIQSTDIRIQSGLKYVYEQIKNNEKISFTFKKLNDGNFFDFCIINYSYASFLSIQETIDHTSIGLSGTNLTEYYVKDDDATSNHLPSSETLILETGLIKKIYDIAIKQENINVETDKDK